MRKAILFTLLGLIVLFIIVGYALPSKWKVERSIVINKTPQDIYPLIASFKKGWPQWSSFDQEDPGIQYTYFGAEDGVGASRSWTSKRMGDGTQSITVANPAKGVEFKLMMTKNNFILTGDITFEPVGNATKVTWADAGDVGDKLFIRYMLVMMDKMIGPAFEKSLANLKAKAEAAK